MKKTKLGQELLEGMQEIIAHQEGKITLRTSELEMLAPPPDVSAKDVAKIRSRNLHMSQGAFAKLLGVSVRVIQSWEQGDKKPSGAARRLLQVASRDPQALLSAATPRKTKAG
ncbi:MAG TPA: helix-turn-helix domain-containing protein [Pseudobdellovibrionaceae bacterium]|jgi:putative transcriptional regulator